MPAAEKTAKELAEFNGDVGNIKPGARFRDRRHLSGTGVHLPLVQGIHSVGDEVFSVVLCGGYEDDVDNGEEIIYVGQGKGAKTGESARGRPQAGDQEWKGANAALRHAYTTRLPIRVIRGDKLNSIYAPNPGGKYRYRYDGLYVVDEWWEAKGKAGYMMCMFRLKRFDDGNVTYVIPKRTG
ncbi:hypothetical protein PTI98_000199 [Pleurotus ostreatus]|nr:hypothetical protein PTI98_000199 [Pleurotus ostreatus]